MGSCPRPPPHVPPHIVIFPFLSKGHTIPLIHLAHLIHRRGLATSLTFITTPLNSPFIRSSLVQTPADIVELPFPSVDDIPDLPHGVESTDQLPSMSLFLPFITATKRLKPYFEQALSSSRFSSDPSTSCILISDGFLGWTVESAATLGIPRVVFYGMGNFAMTVSVIMSRDRPHSGITSYDEPFCVPGFEHLQLTRGDFCPPFDDPDPEGPLNDFVVEQGMATAASHALIVNSFYQLEAPYFDFWNRNFSPKAWNVGPLCLCSSSNDNDIKSDVVMEWLDTKASAGRPVLYVAFGSQAEVSAKQMAEIVRGLEMSSDSADFLWVVRPKNTAAEQVLKEVEESEKLRGKGRVVREWVDQLRILKHESVKGFMSHCGWNSVMESVCGGVPILAWPMMAEQHLNAKFVVEVAGIGLRIPSGEKGGVVKGEDIGRLVRELVVGEEGRRAREKVEELAVVAEEAMAEGGGASVREMEQIIEELALK